MNYSNKLKYYLNDDTYKSQLNYGGLDLIKNWFFDKMFWHWEHNKETGRNEMCYDSNNVLNYVKQSGITANDDINIELTKYICSFMDNFKFSDGSPAKFNDLFNDIINQYDYNLRFSDWVESDHSESFSNIMNDFCENYGYRYHFYAKGSSQKNLWVQVDLQQNLISNPKSQTYWILDACESLLNNYFYAKDDFYGDPCLIELENSIKELINVSASLEKLEQCDLNTVLDELVSIHKLDELSIKTIRDLFNSDVEEIRELEFSR